MGKEERVYVEMMERNVVSELNNRPLDNLDQNDLNRVKDLALFIKSNYEFKSAEHIGNTYGTSIGDIKLIGIKDIFIELKFLKRGTGTRANISQDALTNNNLFSQSPLSWSQFREQNNFSEHIFGLLINCQCYGIDILQLPLTSANIQKLGRIVRDKSEFDVNVQRVKNKISDYANKNKLEYIRYLSSHDYHKDFIKKFAVLLLMGRHTSDSLNEFKKYDFQETLDKIPDNYEIVYVLKKAGHDIYKTEKLYKFINKIESYDVRLSFPEDETNITIDFLKDGSWIKTIRFSYHWKNVFQGIQTPCLNVFVENLDDLFS